MTRPTGQRWHLRTQQQLNGFIEHVKGLWSVNKKPTVQFMAEERSLSQNTMMFALYGDISRQAYDKTVQDVRRECKLTIGIPILRAADQSYSDWYDRTIKLLTYEDKLTLMDHYDVTAMFTKAQGTEYIDTIPTTYTRQGYNLEDPLDAKA